jgi:hypothetical protein
MVSWRLLLGALALLNKHRKKNMTIHVEKEGSQISVTSPYHPAFVRWAKTRNGRYDKSLNVWRFDARDEADVRKKLVAIYGTDGSTEVDLVDIRITLRGDDDYSRCLDSVYVAGRSVVRAYDRDSGAKLGEGCVLISGRISSGGSRANWTTVVGKGTVLELRDVPRSKLKDIDENIWEVKVVRPTPELPAIELTTTPAEESDLAAAAIAAATEGRPIDLPVLAGKGLYPPEQASLVDLTAVPAWVLLGELVRRGYTGELTAPAKEKESNDERPTTH